MRTVPAAGSPVPPPRPRPRPAALREDAGLQSPPAPRADSVKEHVAEGPRVLAVGSQGPRLPLRTATRTPCLWLEIGCWSDIHVRNGALARIQDYHGNGCS